MARTWDANNANYIDLGTAASLNGTGDFTVSVWIKTSAVVLQTIVAQDDAALNGSWVLNMTALGFLEFKIFNTALQVDLIGTTAINDGNWHHVIARKTTITQAIRLDGAAEASNTGTNRALVNTFSTHIGHNPNLGLPFAGDIDDLAIWAISITDNECNSIAKGASPTRIRRSNSRSTHIPIWGNDATEADLFGAAHNGTVVGTLVKAIQNPKTEAYRPYRGYGY